MDVDPHEPVEGHPEQVLLLLPMEPDHEEGHPVVRQRLPGLDEVHLGLKQVQVLHVGVGLQNLVAQLQEKHMDLSWLEIKPDYLCQKWLFFFGFIRYDKMWVNVGN